MDVQNRVWKRRAESCAQSAHEPGETDECRATLANRRRQRRVERLARRVRFMIDHARFDPLRARKLQPRRVRAIRNHEHDLRAQPPRRNRLRNGRQIAAPA